MIDSAVSDLPLPDSPTRQSVSPRGDAEADVDHRRNELPVLLEAGGEVGDGQQRIGIGIGLGFTQRLDSPDP